MAKVFNGTNCDETLDCEIQCARLKQLEIELKLKDADLSKSLDANKFYQQRIWEVEEKLDKACDMNYFYKEKNKQLEKALDKACKDCEAIDEGLAYETSSDNFEVEEWQSRKKRYLEESEKQ